MLPLPVNSWSMAVPHTLSHIPGVCAASPSHSNIPSGAKVVHEKANHGLLPCDSELPDVAEQ